MEKRPSNWVFNLIFKAKDSEVLLDYLNDKENSFIVFFFNSIH